MDNPAHQDFSMWMRGSEYASAKSCDKHPETEPYGLGNMIHSKRKAWGWRCLTLLVAGSVLVVILTTSAFGWIHGFQQGLSFRPQKLQAACRRPTIRREWRSLWPSEKRNYLDAARCLEETPSSLLGQGTLYDDLVYVHMKVGALSHSSPAFLPWHRAFIYIYETILKTRCGFSGSLPYWDWQLDWQHIERSAIWDNDLGFGGDGNLASPLGLGDGRCVTTGPFAHSQRLYFDGEVKPHCLARSFVHHETNATGAISGFWYQPEKMGLVKRATNYNVFREMMEATVHNGLHWSIRGDFSSLTAANDPLFWLHHAQLDRLWWQWQQEDLANRDTEYWGPTENITETPWPSSADVWTSKDVLTFGDLWRDIDVSEVMQTENELLCYRY